MPKKNKNKYEIIDQLENACTKASRLAFALKFAGKIEEAKLARRKVKTLGAKIDDLLAAAMLTWAGNSTKIAEDLKASNKLLQSDINNIKKKKDLANKTIKALGRLDKMIDTAAKIIKKT